MDLKDNVLGTFFCHFFLCSHGERNHYAHSLTVYSLICSFFDEPRVLHFHKIIVRTTSMRVTEDLQNKQTCLRNCKQQ